MMLPTSTPEQRRSRLAVTIALRKFAWKEFASAKVKARVDCLARSQIGLCAKWWSLIGLGHGHALSMSQECTGENSSVS